MDVDLDKEPAFFEDFEEETINKIIKRHSNIVRRQKEAGQKKLYGCLIIVDDFADDASIMHKRSGSILNKLFLSGRHHAISTIVSVQKLTMVSAPMRVNATGLLLFKVRARNERDAAENFVSALLDRDEFLELYEAATKQPYSFLYVKLNAKTLNDTFYIRFEKRAVPNMIIFF